MWGWLKLDSGMIILTYTVRNTEYSVLQFQDDAEFEDFFKQTSVFAEKLLVPNAFKKAFE